MADLDAEKQVAARAALAHVADGMRLGLGTGSTAEHFVRVLGERVAGGLRVIGVPTSERTAALARSLSIPLTTLEETPELDLTVDGADEADRKLRLIKGGGGALLREKIVAAASARMIVIADSTKVVETLGRFPLPVEVNPFGLGATEIKVRRVLDGFGLGGVPMTLRRMKDGAPFMTDGGHYILDCACGRITDPDGLAQALSCTPGVVDHGLFIRLASTLIIGEGGTTTEIEG